MSSNELERTETNLSPVQSLEGINYAKTEKPRSNEQENAANEPFCFLNIYKPKGITSFDVIYKLRKRLGIKKIGHSGTLDPLADGVMQVAIGRATRLLDYLSSDKTYHARIKFGYFSTTGDAEGEIMPANPPKFSEDDLQNALKSMIGEIEQIPPIYSAIKVGGKKLCDLARKNAKKLSPKEVFADFEISKTLENPNNSKNPEAPENPNNPENSKKPAFDVEIPKRIVTIYNARIINLIKIYKTDKNSQIQEAEIEISCSKGTYIRTFAEDLAKKLNTGAYLTSLTRTVAGEFKIENSIKIEDVNLSSDGILPHLALQNKTHTLNFEEYKLVLNGVSFAPSGEKPPENVPLSLIYENNLVSIGILSDNKIVCKKVFK